ncbi:MAG: efflux RND transporter periplasmic adaptor subunit [Candidatus Thiodiazotropha sp. (ex Myrtea spinifera)]|nr:efflux RND transporter periplasmic adaptor subunit [Candidatus Thiodiazotropha sp. (ex Myrtea spinifera)]
MSSPPTHVAEIWLEKLSRLVSGVASAVVVEMPVTQTAAKHVTAWPSEEATGESLIAMASQAATTRRQFVRAAEQGDEGQFDLLAVPLISGEHVLGGVAILLTHRSEAKLNAAMQALQWGKQWLELLMERAHDSGSISPEWLGDMTGKEISPDELVRHFASHFQCDRVTLAMGDHRSLDILATHPKVEIKRETGLVRSFKEAMFEAMDQEGELHYPAMLQTGDKTLRFHQALSERIGSPTLLTLPLVVAGKTVGALLLERHQDQPFTEPERETCCRMATMAGVMMQYRYQAERPLLQLMGERLRERLGLWLGANKLWLKVSLLLAAAVIGLLSWLDGEYRIDAEASLEGRVQRMVIAPFDGYLKLSHVKAGDRVEQGAVLCELDDRDLQLERVKWQTQLAKLEKEQREAMAAHERARVAILHAQRQQAQAELDLVEKKLERSIIVAPLSGIVVSGDLSQSLGAPLKRGETLFKVAPLDSYRVMLQVDELDIADVQPGQGGSLILTGYPHLRHAFEVKRILPLSTAEEGRHLFTLEAELAESGQSLRPGMQGVAKIEAGERSLLWLSTHRLVDWLRLQLWGWWG